MRRSSVVTAALAAALLSFAVPASAWHRGHTEIFAVVPDLPGNVPVGIEGLTVGPDGTVYTPSAGFNSQGAVSGPPHLFSFKPNGELLGNVALVNPAPHSTQPTPTLLGLVYQASSKTLLICDLGQGIVWQANPANGNVSIFMNTGLGGSSGLNALTFDKAGNVYVSDSFQGVIWETGPNGGTGPSRAPTTFVDSQTLSPEGAAGVILVPPFGANGVEFNNEYTIMYVANTAYHSIVQVPVSNNNGSASVAGPAAVLTTGINSPDGLAVDSHDNLWVDANQGDEIIVIDPTATDALGKPLAKIIAKRGDFHGLSDDGTVQGLLFPASPAFSSDGKYVYTSNFALYLPYAGVPETAVDSPWTLEVKHTTIAKIRAVIPPFPDRAHHHHDGQDDGWDR